MAIGYLVTLGNGALERGDVIATTAASFSDTATRLGAGTWTISGVVEGQSVTNYQLAGTYYLSGTSVYFVPDSTVTAVTAATVGWAPAYNTATTFSGSGGGNTWTGSGANETAFGNGGNDSLLGNGGADVLNGGIGNDTLNGGDGNDRLIGGPGSDSLIGGTGTDVADYSAETANLTVNLTTGAVSGGNATGDVLSGVEGVIGGSGNDTLIGFDSMSGDPFAGGSTNVLDGGAGNDRIEGYAGNDSLFGGDGADTIFGLGNGAQDGTDDDFISGGAGNDLIDGDRGNDSIEGGSGNDTILAGTGNDRVLGGSGLDSIEGGAGADWIDGGADADVIKGDLGNDTLFGGTGNDTITGGPDSQSSTPLDLRLDWTADGRVNGTNAVGGFTTNMGGVNAKVTITDPPGGATLSSANISTTQTYVTGGTDPNSSLQLTASGTGTNSVTRIDFTGVAGSGQSDQVQNVSFFINDIDGTSGGWRDVLTINAWDENGVAVPVSITLFGNDSAAGNTITALIDPDDPNQPDGSALVQIAGPVKRLEITYANALSTTQIIYYSDISAQSIPLPANDDDLIYGGDGNDVLFGALGNDTIDGGNDADSISGGAGDDSLLGGAGDDTLDGGTGNDTLDGGLGNDQLSGADGDDVLAGGEGDDTLTGGIGDDRLFGDAGADSLVGGDGADLIEGGLGDDILFGDAGADTLSGGAGNDTLNGGTGNDQLSGDEGADSLVGGEGDDTLSGGIGDDRLFGDAGADSLAGGDGADLVEGGLGDDILFGDDGADTLVGGVGNDTLTGGAGADLIQGGDDQDRIIVQTQADGFGDVVDGGAGGAVDYDVLDLSQSGPLHRKIFTTPNQENGYVEFLDAQGNVIGTLTFTDIEKIICFAAGTRIATPFGAQPVETLRPGDLVLTRDNGPQPIRWVGARTVAAQGDLAPIRFETGALGNSRPLLVSPQHRMLCDDWRAQMLFGETEVLVAAKHLVNDRTIRRAPGGLVSYHHILFDRHEIVMAEGVASESFHPGDEALSALDGAARGELLRLFPELVTGSGARLMLARRALRGFEGRLLA